MSFITKRDRVFNEYDKLDLPSRNEGRLKAYSSCTDARAWSHFGSDKTEHLVDIIKRNNETCRTKYLPTDVIVNTLMKAKNAEIARLKRRMEEFEQMLSVYDQLDLTSDQKSEIAKAHAAIKAVNQDLDDLYLDLDISSFTEGSETFETGKSKGDETSRLKGESGKGDEDNWSYKVVTPKVGSKAIQAECPCQVDVSTSAHDPRIEEMKDIIISKDARLSTMQNTLAVLESDVCEPYNIYASIYTALEKIFGALCQNDKYKQYLDCMTSGRDTISIDIKGRILFKLKVLEKFCMALIAPCTDNTGLLDDSPSRIETTYALTSSEYKMPHNLDNERAQLVAEIIQNDEMKEILSKEDTFGNVTEIAKYDVESENLIRLKNLQADYEDLMSCHEQLKKEKQSLQEKYDKCGELEKEYEGLRAQLREYPSLWNEKEYYKRRSEDLDTLKEQYFLLNNDASNLENKLKAESQINSIKANTIEDLRNENIELERKLNDALIAFEKEKNSLHCKLKETECKVICQEQQINSLSAQIDRLLEQDRNKMVEEPKNSLDLLDEIQSLKSQNKQLLESLELNEEEKQRLQESYQENLNIINDLKLQIEDWKSAYEKTLQRNDYLEQYSDNIKADIEKLLEENKSLSQDMQNKSDAVKNLYDTIGKQFI